MTNPIFHSTPNTAIREAAKTHPAFKYATGVLGLVGVVAVVARWGISPQTAIFGCVLLVVLMVLFLVFTQAAALSRSTLSVPARVLVWSLLVVAIATAYLLFSSAFFDKPLPLRTAIVESMTPSPGARAAASKPLPMPSPTPKVYTGEKINLNLKNAEIHDVLIKFSELTGLSIVADADVHGSVTINAVDIPWDQALEAILTSNGLTYTLIGTVMQVSTLSTTLQRERALKDLREVRKSVE